MFRSAYQTDRVRHGPIKLPSCHWPRLNQILPIIRWVRDSMPWVIPPPPPRDGNPHAFFLGTTFADKGLASYKGLFGFSALVVVSQCIVMVLSVIFSNYSFLLEKFVKFVSAHLKMAFIYCPRYYRLFLDDFHSVLINWTFHNFLHCSSSVG